MRIAVVTAEAEPFSKTGGLADVAGALFNEYSKLGHDSYLFVPLYKRTQEQFKDIIHDTGAVIDIPLGKATRKCRVFTLKESEDTRRPGDPENVSTSPRRRVAASPHKGVFFIGNDEYFGRDELYGTPDGDYPDNDQRFVFFCRSVLEICKLFNLKIDVMHCNDWQSGLIPVYLKTLYRQEPVFSKSRSVITIHNLGYQGIFPSQTMEITGLDWGLFNPEGIEFYGNVNMLKAGIVGADVITTVSRTYAKEILTPEYGFGLDGVLRKRADSIVGILNGIDYTQWDPSTDKFLPRTYDRNDISGKSECKRELMKICGLSGDITVPLLCFIGRLSEQKGIDMLASVVPGLIAEGLNVVIIGKGEGHYQTMLNSLKDRYGKKLFFYSGFGESIAHLGYAGSDIFMMPSRYEPCGIGQLIALHYGTISVARNTGGLKDTIKDGEVGFLFDEYSLEAFTKGIKRALNAYADKKLWQGIMKKAMNKDFSWGKPAKKYIDVCSGKKT